MRLSTLLITSLLAFASCGKKDSPAPAPTSPAPAADTAPTAPGPAADATPAAQPDAAPAAKVDAAPAEPEVAPAPSRRGFIAWASNPDGELETALFLEGDTTPLAKKAGVVAVAVDDKVFNLGREASTFPLKPCDEPGEASLEALAVTGVEPTVPKKVVEVCDLKNRPKPNESWIHVERLLFVAQAGPFVLLHHEQNSDTCPIPAGGATYDAWRVLDLSTLDPERAPAPAELKSLWAADKLAEAEAAALVEGRKVVKKAFPDADQGEIDKVLKIYEPRFGWSDEGKLEGSATAAGNSTAFSGMVDEEGYAAEKVPFPLPPQIGEVEPPPAAVIEYWKSHKAEGRGYSKVSGQALETLALWLAAR